MMQFHIISLFPEFFSAFMSHSMIKRAIQSDRISIDMTNPRDFSHSKHGQVDDTPYGGGSGMLMMAPPLFEAVESALGMSITEYKEEQRKLSMDVSNLVKDENVQASVGKRRIIFLGPTGERLTQEKAKELAQYDELILLCGHYEGIDYRVEEHVVDETISIGDFVLTGGELPAMVVIDAVARMIPGVLGSTSGAIEDSFYHPLLEAPQYTKPPEYRGLIVPDVLRSGHHKNIAQWRLEESIKRTQCLRPDLLERELTKEEERVLKSLQK